VPPAERADLFYGQASTIQVKVTRTMALQPSKLILSGSFRSVNTACIRVGKYEWEWDFGTLLDAADADPTLFSSGSPQTNTT